MPNKKRVAYFYDKDVGHYSYGLGHPMKPYRMRMTHSLVSAYGMLEKMQVLRPRRSTPEEMTKFHTDEYIEFLNKVTPETTEELTLHGQRFLVGEDNPAFDGVFEFCSISAGGSVGAAERVNNGECDIAINWAGGLHHAKKREASGFCYINDIVLSILELLRMYPRVLYIDIDCHHGDGVEEAFYTTDRVLACSFHKFGEYFPGTGHVDDRGWGKGHGYSVNVPLKDGLTDKAFKGVFEPVISRILEWYRPSAIILQLGADSLAGDKLGCFNVSMQGHAHSVNFLRNSGIPLILLGGGGYTIKNVARLWTYETACALGIEEEIDKNLPYNDYFDWFGPRYRLEVPENNMEDVNEKDGYLENIKREVLEHLQDLPFAPSVGMQEVPGESVGEHIGYTMDEDVDEISDMDEQIAAKVRSIYGVRESSGSDSEEDHAQTPPHDVFGTPMTGIPEDYESTDSEGGRRVRGRRKPNGPTSLLPNGLSSSSKNHPIRRKFFPSSMVWDTDRREVVRVNSTSWGDGFDGPVVVVADEDMGMNVVDDGEAEGVDVEEDGEEEASISASQRRRRRASMLGGNW